VTALVLAGKLLALWCGVSIALAILWAGFSLWVG
jgi:hypothetical protein